MTSVDTLNGTLPHGITSHIEGHHEFGFSNYEDAASAEAAFHDVMQELLRVSIAGDTVVINQVPDHLTPLIEALEEQLNKRKIRAERTKTSSD